MRRRAIVLGISVVTAVAAWRLSRDESRDQPKTAMAAPRQHAAYPIPIRRSPSIPAEPSVTSTNPLIAVASSGMKDAISERNALEHALAESGDAKGIWVSDASQRILDIQRYLDKMALGTSETLGCFSAGCGLKIHFGTADAGGELERLADPLGEGVWPHGVIITEPRQSAGADDYITLLLLVSPA